MSGVIERTRRAGHWTAAPDRTTAGFAVRGLGGGLVHGTLPVREAWVEVDRAGQPVAAHAVVVTSESDGDITVTATSELNRLDAGVRAPRVLVGGASECGSRRP